MPPDRLALDAVPEFAHTLQPHGNVVAGNDRTVDGADRGTDDPVRLDPCFVQRLVDAALISAERAAALKDKDHLPRQFRRRAQFAGGLVSDINLIHTIASRASGRCFCMTRNCKTFHIGRVRRDRVCVGDGPPVATQTADLKACTEQERSNQTLSEKLG